MKVIGSVVLHAFLLASLLGDLVRAQGMQTKQPCCYRAKLCRNNSTRFEPTIRTRTYDASAVSVQYPYYQD